MYVSGRERKIVELLLTAQADLSIKEIANMIEVSERTIHRDLKNIEKIFLDHHLELAKQPGKGIRLIGDSEDKRQLELALHKVAHTDFTSDERQAIILSTLLDMNEPVKLFTLAHELNVTVATISNDLDQVMDRLATYDLSLIRRRGYGVKVEGNEANKRAALSKLIATYFDTFDFVSLIKETIQNKSQHQLDTISNRLLGLVNPEKLEKIEEAVDSLRNKLPYELADNAYIGIVVHLALAIERLQQGDIIEFDPTYLEQIKGTKEYEIAKRLLHDLEDVFQMNIPVDEIGYITMHLMGAKLRIDQNYLIEESSLDIAYKAEELIQYVGTQLNEKLTQNASLLNDLVAHLKPTIYRLQQGMNINNPLLEEIRRDYQDLFYLIHEGASEVFPDIDFPDDEIGYLVLHFAAALLQGKRDINIEVLVVCASGIGTAKILATKLMQYIPEINRVENVSFFDLGNIDPNEYDIVVSTILLNGFEREYIRVSPILTKTEINKINKIIKQKKLSYKPLGNELTTKRKETYQGDLIQRLELVQSYSKAIVNVLNSFHLKEIHATANKTIDAILKSICNNLERDQMIRKSQNVFEKLLQREQLGGLGIPNSSLALYHTRTNDVLKPIFTIYSLSHPLAVQGMDGKIMDIDTIMLMLAPEETHHAVLEILSFLSSLIIQSEESLKLFETGTEEQVKQFLSEQFNQFLIDKNLL